MANDLDDECSRLQQATELALPARSYEVNEVAIVVPPFLFKNICCRVHVKLI
jgi:hypothetical protein